MSDPDPKRRLAELEAKIEAAKAGKDAGRAHQEEHYSQAQVAWRMVTELVAGLGIGFAIGYGLDMAFGSAPFLMVVFTLLGLAAGIKTMLRSAEELSRRQAAQAADEDGKRRENGD